MTAIDAERQMLENTAEDLKADGYEVFLRPSITQLPPFMKNYRPDAIAFRADKNLAIEVRGGRKQSVDRIDQLQRLFSGPEAKDWTFKVLVVWPERTLLPLELAKTTEIEAALSEVEILLSKRETRPALLMSWAVLEAMGRVLEPQKISRPQTPRRLIEVLAREGHVTPSEADKLRTLIDLRNGLIHGDLNIDVGLQETLDFQSILVALRDSLRVPESA